jgi:hypothetical protein
MLFVIANLAQQGVAISSIEIATVAALPRNDDVRAWVPFKRVEHRSSQDAVSEASRIGCSKPAGD